MITTKGEFKKIITEIQLPPIWETQSSLTNEFYNYGKYANTLPNESESDDVLNFLKEYDIQYAKKGFLWMGGDWSTVNARPQGISHHQTQEGNRMLAISWYSLKHARAYKNEICRVSLILNENNRYKYINVMPVILTEDQGDIKAEVIRSHAGGLAILGNYLFLADSSLKHSDIEPTGKKGGIRVFDLTKIYPLNNVIGNITTQFTTENNIIATEEVTEVVGGTLDAPYILPEICHYEMSMPFTEASDDSNYTRFSFASIDYTDITHPKLLTGNFSKKSDKTVVNKPEQACLWGLTKVDNGYEITSFEESIGTDLPNSQGIIKYRDKVIISASWSNKGMTKYVRVGNIVNDGNNKMLNNDYTFKGGWATGTEDLSYDVDSNEMWGLTEFSVNYDGDGRRFVYCCDFAKVYQMDIYNNVMQGVTLSTFYKNDGAYENDKLFVYKAFSGQIVSCQVSETNGITGILQIISGPKNCLDWTFDNENNQLILLGDGNIYVYSLNMEGIIPTTGQGMRAVAEMETHSDYSFTNIKWIKDFGIFLFNKTNDTGNENRLNGFYIPKMSKLDEGYSLGNFASELDEWGDVNLAQFYDVKDNVFLIIYTNDMPESGYNSKSITFKIVQKNSKYTFSKTELEDNNYKNEFEIMSYFKRGTDTFRFFLQNNNASDNDGFITKIESDGKAKTSNEQKIDNWSMGWHTVSFFSGGLFVANKLEGRVIVKELTRSGKITDKIQDEEKLVFENN